MSVSTRSGRSFPGYVIRRFHRDVAVSLPEGRASSPRVGALGHFAARGVTTENTTPVDGYFIVSTRADASATDEVGRVDSVIYDWMR